MFYIFVPCRIFFLFFLLLFLDEVTGLEPMAVTRHAFSSTVSLDRMPPDHSLCVLRGATFNWHRALSLLFSLLVSFGVSGSA